MEQVIDILESTRELLENENRWVQRKVAVNTNGRQVEPCSEDAIQWCLVGALSKVAFQGEIDIEKQDKIPILAATVVLRRRKRGLDYIEMVRGIDAKYFIYIIEKLQDWNDDPCRQHADIIDAIDDSIAIIKEEYYTQQ